MLITLVNYIKGLQVPWKKDLRLQDASVETEVKTGNMKVSQNKCYTEYEIKY